MLETLQVRVRSSKRRNQERRGPREFVHVRPRIRPSLMGPLRHPLVTQCLLEKKEDRLQAPRCGDGKGDAVCTSDLNNGLNREWSACNSSVTRVGLSPLELDQIDMTRVKDYTANTTPYKPSWLEDQCQSLPSYHTMQPWPCLNTDQGLPIYNAVDQTTSFTLVPFRRVHHLPFRRVY